jgi:hypothetical protein
MDMNVCRRFDRNSSVAFYPEKTFLVTGLGTRLRRRIEWQKKEQSRTNVRAENEEKNYRPVVKWKDVLLCDSIGGILFCFKISSLGKEGNRRRTKVKKKGENRTETKSNLRPFWPMICLSLFYSFSLHQSLVLESPEDVSSNHYSGNTDCVHRSCCNGSWRFLVVIWRAVHNLLPFVPYMFFSAIWNEWSGKYETHL